MNKKKTNFNNKILIIGKFGKFYGIHKWIKLFSYTENTNDIFLYKNLFILYTNKEKYFISFQQYKKKKYFYITKLDNINYQYINLVNQYIYIKYNDIITYKKNNEYYWYDIIGCNIINSFNQLIGVVINIIATGSNDVMIVRLYNKKKIITIPFILKQVIIKVDLNNHIIQIN
ncbi:ribosome maturation factor RimM [Enterobacteriaceae endosymbiont of Neohaemonia nigricornis]|uniref:ribosome maturation factor RimM n=1 Tax=Enterobacteriaceae endosymbiont of Neohaemonia nigricornis TaxID=2675792 RepID=UPI001449B7BC|nr:ribosome maturation factor RimM [Enterobacteriaceae endosymbiont of Neohaemonia nigricornis]QJC30578.1 16S rRNA processing protein RimM [Enterobacteriaceae endosymbiont of Neohaemonia nigricornis]